MNEMKQIINTVIGDMINKIIKNNKININTVSTISISNNTNKLFRILGLAFISSGQICPICKTSTRLEIAGAGKISCSNHKTPQIFSVTRGTFLHKSRILSNPMKWFTLLAVYNYTKNSNIKYGVKSLVVRTLNIDRKNVKEYWKKFDGLANDKFFQKLSSIFRAKIIGKRGSYNIKYYYASNPVYMTRTTGVLVHGGISYSLTNKIINSADDFKILSNVLRNETYRYTKHDINLKSQKSREILSHALYLIYYYQQLLKKSGETELLHNDFEEFATAFVSFYYRGRMGRRLSHIIPSFKLYIYEYFEHMRKGCGGQFSPCGFCQFNNEYKPRLYKPNVAINKYEGYIFKNLKNEFGQKPDKMQFMLLAKLSRYINKVARNIVDHINYNFSAILRYVFDGVKLCFRKIEVFMKKVLDNINCLCYNTNSGEPT